MEFWNQRTFCLVTGASRGIGKTIAIEFAKKFGQGSVLLLVARSAQALEETKAEILENSSGVKVVTAALDLGKPDAKDYLHLLNSAFITTETKANDFDHNILVHNAGSLGDISLRVIEMSNPEALREFFDFNVISLIILTSQFFKIFNDSSKQRSVVHITSLGAIKAMNSLGQYCSAKAARDSIVRSIASEDPSISAISYSPGPVDTGMYDQIGESAGDPETAKNFRELKKAGGVLSVIETITKLIRILGEKNYTKGEHVDYFDVDDIPRPQLSK